MSGIRHNPLSDISDLRELLDSAYLASAILQELVQNTDDAGSRTLYLASHPGLPASAHPLLRVPALLVLNDGHFRKQDAKAIPYKGLGAKGNDTATIGKFGRGLKSVFHLCEAFFYTASRGQPGIEWKDYDPILNPWESTGFHRDWEGVKREVLVEEMQAAINAWPHCLDQWFLLWLPLRSESLLGGTAPISNEYPVASDFLEPAQARRMAVFMPLLRSLAAYGAWQLSDGSPVQLYEVRREQEAGRSAFRLGTLRAGTRGPVQGVIGCNRGGERDWEYRFSGLEMLGENRELDQIKATRPGWPESPTFDRETGAERMEPDKAEQHAAAVFGVMPDRAQPGASLAVSDSVFLPLSGHEATRDDHAFHLLLHGYFFVDAGRRARIGEGDPKDGHAVPADWNRVLERELQHPLLLPALDEFVREAELDGDLATSLTRGIEGSEALKKHRESICREFQWLHCCTTDGSAWSLRPSSEPFWVLPSANADAIAPRDVLPGLSSFTAEHCTVLRSEPRLTARQPENWAPHLPELLDHVPADKAFADPDYLEYLLRFLGETGASRGCQAQLVCLMRRALRECSLEHLISNADGIKRFLGLLPSELLIPIPQLRSGLAGRAVRELAALNTEAVFLPQKLAQPTTSYPRLSLSDGDAVLQWACTLPREGRTGAAVAFLNMVAAPSEKRNRYGALRLFQGLDYSRATGEQHIDLSWDKLEELLTEGRLVARFFNPLPALAEALSGERFVALTQTGTEVEEALFEGGAVPTGGEDFCFRFLQAGPVLQRYEGRRLGIFKLLSRSTSHSCYREVMRYLLHADRQHLDDLDPPLLADDVRRDGAVWGRVVQHILSRTQQQWCYVPSALVEELTPAQCAQLGVRPAESEVVEQLLRTHGKDSLDGLTLSEHERTQLLTQLLKEVRDAILWLSLKLHRTAGGDLTPIVDPETTYVRGKISLPPSLSDKVLLLALPSSEELQERYRSTGLKHWSYSATLDAALAANNPDTYWREIMDALRGLGDSVANSAGMLERLRGTPWLPTSWDPAKPCEVVVLPETSEELNRLVSRPELRGVYPTELQLTEGLTSHAAYPLLKEHVLPSVSESFDILRLLLEGLDSYHVGDLTGLRDGSVSCADYLASFEGAAAGILPSLGLLRAIERVDSYRPYLESALRAMLGPVEPGTMIQCLRELRSALNADKSLTVYNLYLDALRRAVDGIGAFQNVELRSRAGSWKRPEQLCVDQPGIDPHDVLDPKQEQILSSIIPPEPAALVDLPATAAPSPAFQGVAALKEYFAGWNGLIPNETIGGFLAVLGGDAGIRSLAQEYLGHRWKVDDLRSRLHWVPLELALLGSHAAGHGEDIHEAMRHQHFGFAIHHESGQLVTVANLFGKPFQARTNPEIKSIFVGRLEDALRRDCRLTRCTLRSFDPSVLTRQQRSDVLKESAAILLDQVYRQDRPDNLDELWKELDESYQVDLEVAQDVILEAAPHYLGQLDTQSQRQIRSLRHEWDALKYDEVQERRAGGKELSPALVARQCELAHRLRRLVEADSDFQQEMLESLRRKVRQSQYDETSAAFELLQNADDACVELTEMEPGARALDRFEVRCSVRCIEWLHWGRPINLARSRRLSTEDGRRRGYHMDLCKMLTLSSSDKTGQDLQVTGKFGLGFKSVFLLSDLPRVVSSDLCFEVVGGIYPRRPSRETLGSLQESLPGADDAESRRATLIQVPMLDKIAPEDVLLPFEQMAHVQVVFTRSIRRIDLLKEHCPRETVHWTERQIPGVRAAFTGTLTPYRRSGLTQAQAIVFRAGGVEQGALLLQMDSQGIVPMPEWLPVYWATTPARGDDKGLGLALNLPFQVDPGRGQLASSPDNEKLAAQFGLRLGDCVEQLFKASQRWETFRSSLHLAEDAESYAFWFSLWNVITDACRKSRGVEKPILRAALLARGGLRRVWADHETVPSGLPGAYKKLVALSRVRYQVTGLLDRSTDRLTKVSGWASVQQRCQPGQVISASRTASMAFESGLLGPVHDLRLLDVLQWELGDETLRVSPSSAAHLGKLVTRDLINDMSSADATRAEAKELAEWLGRLEFLAQDSSYAPAGDLLIPAACGPTDQDELLRAAVAPADRLLSAEYEGSALAFFRACRHAMAASAEVLRDWGLRAADEGRRKAFLVYLLRGELGGGITISYADRESSWLRKLDTSPLLDSFEPSERMQILGKLGHFSYVAPPFSQTVPTPTRRIPLQRVAKWWEEHREDQVGEHNRRLYPEGVRYLHGITHHYSGTAEERQAWLRLLIRSGLEPLGRTKHEQHRGFLRMAEERGWLSSLAEDPESVGAVVDQMREYVGAKTQYIHYLEWMKQFLGMLLFIGEIDSYVDALLGLNQIEGHIDPLALLRPRTNPLNQRGGPDAPPLDGLLGIGACYLLRELVRIDAVKNEKIHPFCFVPSLRVRTALTYCGIEFPDDEPRLIRSQFIYRAIQEELPGGDPTFGGAFDIPFQIIAESADLRDDLLGAGDWDLEEEDI